MIYQAFLFDILAQMYNDISNIQNDISNFIIVVMYQHYHARPASSTSTKVVGGLVGGGYMESPRLYK